MECECGETDDLRVCEECGAAFCMACYCHYEARATSRLCWRCQAAADREWLAAGLAPGGPRRQARKEEVHNDNETGC